MWTHECICICMHIYNTTTITHSHATYELVLVLATETLFSSCVAQELARPKLSVHLGAAEPDLPLRPGLRRDVSHVHHGRGEGAPKCRRV